MLFDSNKYTRHCIHGKQAVFMNIKLLCMQIFCRCCCCCCCWHFQIEYKSKIVPWHLFAFIAYFTKLLTRFETKREKCVERISLLLYFFYFVSLFILNISCMFPLRIRAVYAFYFVIYKNKRLSYVVFVYAVCTRIYSMWFGFTCHIQFDSL